MCDPAAVAPDLPVAAERTAAPAAGMGSIGFGPAAAIRNRTCSRYRTCYLRTFGMLGEPRSDRGDVDFLCLKERMAKRRKDLSGHINY